MFADEYAELWGKHFGPDWHDPDEDVQEYYLFKPLWVLDDENNEEE